MKQRTIYAIMTAGGVLGMTAAFAQTLEKLTLLQNKNAELVCNLNGVFSCSNVLNSWQNSVFGFPNSIMCLTLFTIFTTTGLAGLLGSRLTRSIRLAIQALSLVTFGFALWVLWQDTYSIGSLCIFCLICFAGLLMLNWGWARLNIADMPIGKAAQKLCKRAIASGADIFVWILIGLCVGFAMLLHFA